MTRVAQLAAVLIATVLVCGTVLALNLPGLIDEWHRALAETAPPPTAVHDTAPRKPPARPDRGGPARRPAETTAARRREASNTWVRIVVATWLLLAAAPLALAALSAALRLRARRAREYRLYELSLSMHDEARADDVGAMVETIANLVRRRPEQRLLRGQPFVCLELHYGPADHGLAWTLAIRCEPSVATALDGVIAAAYPDVRLGHGHDETPRPLSGRLPEPGCVLRYRKARPFIHPLCPEPDGEARPALETIALQQVRLGRPSSLRMQLTPAPLWLEAFARWRQHRHEQSASGARPARGERALRRAEMTAAARAQHRALLWLELQVAADTHADAERIGAALQAHRAENRLHRRRMAARAGLYRGRFPIAAPPLWPTPSLRTLASAAEVAHLVTLPSASMKGVPARRIALPRLPAPAEAERGAVVEIAAPDS